MFAGTTFRYLSALTITVSKMLFLQYKYAHTMKKECSDLYCIHSHFIGSLSKVLEYHSKTEIF